jgi:hypothetical protein
MEEEVEGEEVEEGGIAHSSSCAPSFRSWISSQTCISASGDDGDTAAYESEFGCSQDVSIITESETGRGGEIGLEGLTEGMLDEGEGEEDGVRAAMWDAQLFFLLLAAFGWEAMGGDDAAGEAGFCCAQRVSFAALTSETAELEGRREGRGVIGVRIRMVR